MNKKQIVLLKSSFSFFIILLATSIIFNIFSICNYIERKNFLLDENYDELDTISAVLNSIIAESPNQSVISDSVINMLEQSCHKCSRGMNELCNGLSFQNYTLDFDYYQFSSLIVDAIYRNDMELLKKYMSITDFLKESISNNLIYIFEKPYYVMSIRSILDKYEEATIKLNDVDTRPPYNRKVLK